MNYYDHINRLPAPLFEINELCWDFTGRPRFENSYDIAIGKLCDMSDTYDEFVANCDRFFFEEKPRTELRLVWHVYFKGIMRTANFVKGATCV